MNKNRATTWQWLGVVLRHPRKAVSLLRLGIPWSDGIVKIPEADETIRPPSALFTKPVKLSPVVDSQTIGFSMSAFGDLMTLQFLQDAFVTDFLTTKVGLPAIFNAAYNLTDLQLHDLTLASVDRKTFQSPTFESIRITGTHERITPTMERSQIERSMRRYGRLVWVEVQLDLTLATKVQQLAMPIDSIRTANLIEDLGGVTSLADLRTKLQTRYSPSVVDAMFKALRISTLGDFQERMNLLVQLFFKPAPAFDPADPASSRVFPVTVCVKFQADLNISDALQAAKLCRAVMEKETDFNPSQDGAEIKTPYVIVTVYPNSVVKDNAIPGLTAAQITSSVQTLFTAEGMVANFFAGA